MSQKHCPFTAISNLRRTGSAGLVFVVPLFFAINVSAGTEFQGSLNSVSITDSTGSNLPPVSKFTYTKNAGSYTFDGGDSTDPDGNIVEYKWDFGDGAVVAKTDGQPFTIELSEGAHVVTLGVVDNDGGASLSQQSIQNSSDVNLFINFQPANIAPPSGALIDSGEGYSQQLKYGWTTPAASVGGWQTNMPWSPDVSYDTMVFTLAQGVWEIALDNGTYDVTICVGDARTSTATVSVDVEGEMVFDRVRFEPTLRWKEKLIQAQISDGKLTVSFNGSDPVAPINWVKISTPQ